MAGYDPNAALCGRALRDRGGAYDPDDESEVSEWALTGLREVLTARIEPEPQEPPAALGPGRALRDRVRHEIWIRLGRVARLHSRWLTYRDGAEPSASQQVRALIALLRRDAEGLHGQAAHADLHHLAVLLAAAIEENDGRALRSVVPPPDGDGRFERYLRTKAATQPLLWPSAHDYAREVLPTERAHAVVTVPTGAGKSAVAELAIAHTMHRGWILYLAPTNALVGQIYRALSRTFAGHDVMVRELLGGGEYSLLDDDELGTVGACQILVMTPEKCSLTLRQDPDAFNGLALCVLDEAHLIDESSGRGAITELVMAEVMYRAPRVRILMLSALIANASEMATWLTSATGAQAVPIDHPWRPTRTVRAVAGFDDAGAQEALTAAAPRLSRLTGNNKKVAVAAPVALLAGLQGSWRTDDPQDYSIVHTSVSAPIGLHRDQGMISEGTCNPLVRALVQALGDNGQRVLAFMPLNKNDSFVQAVGMSGFASSTGLQPDPDIDALLTLADMELGVPTLLRSVLGTGVAVHTGALLREEQRASELAFDRGRAQAMFATGTLAQGLNLPATAVVIAGTQIGYDPGASREERARTTAKQLLNAIGRAGRAYIAPRSMAVVVPSTAMLFSSSTQAPDVLREAKAPFLAQDDASNYVSSRLDGLVRKALGGTLEVATMDGEEQTVFAFLAFAEDSGDQPAVLQRTWGVYRAGATDAVRMISSQLQHTGGQFLDEADVPAWLTIAAHRSGLGLRETTLVHTFLHSELTEFEPPNTIIQWGDLLIDLLGQTTPHQLSTLLPSKPYSSTTIAKLWGEDVTAREEGLEALRATLRAWMSGAPLIHVAAAALRQQSANDASRGRKSPLPKIIDLVERGFGFRLNILAGAMGAIVAAGREAGEGNPWMLPEISLRALSQLPFAIRWGADSPGTIAWIRAGARPRTIAHLLEHHQPLSGNGTGASDRILLISARLRLARLQRSLDDLELDEQERDTLHSLIVTRANRNPDEQNSP